MIPYLDLKAQYEQVGTEIEAAVVNALRSTRYALGPDVEKFEEDFAAFSNTKYAVAVSSGTSALHLALLAAGVKEGDEVITVPMTFIATVASVHYIGAKPILIDVDPDTYTMNPDNIEAAITSKTKAILPVHLYGQCAQMDKILEIGKKHNIPVIEDAAQAHGAEFNGQRAGSMGLAGCFSFYAGKNLGACGEAGAITTNSEEIAKKLRILRDWGSEKKYDHKYVGFNYRMDGVQGAALGVKLKYLEEWTEKRIVVGKLYSELLKDSGLKLPIPANNNRHVYHIYPVMHPDRDRLQAALTEKDIQSGLHYPIPAHLTEAYSFLGYKAGDFPVAERIAKEELSLPVYAEMPLENVEIVAAALKEII